MLMPNRTLKKYTYKMDPVNTLLLEKKLRGCVSDKMKCCVFHACTTRYKNFKKWFFKNNYLKRLNKWY